MKAAEKEIMQCKINDGTLSDLAKLNKKLKEAKSNVTSINDQIKSVRKQIKEEKERIKKQAKLTSGLLGKDSKDICLAPPTKQSF